MPYENFNLMFLDGVLDDIAAEREKQFRKWGEQDHDLPTWVAILTEELGEFAKEVVDYTCMNPEKQDSGRSFKDVQYERLSNIRKELIQTAAVAVQIVEAIDKGGKLDK